MSSGFTPVGEVVTTVEIIDPTRRGHVCQLPPAEAYMKGTLARCGICGDVWLARHSREGERFWGQWWRLGWWGRWKYRKVLR